MKFVFLKIILCCFTLFIFSVEADQSQSKADQLKSQEKEVQPQVKKEEQSQPQVKKEEQSQPQVKKEEQSQPQVKKEEQSQPQVKKEEQSQPQVKKKEPQKASGQLQILEIKKGTATVKVPANQRLSVDQILYVDPIIYPGDTPPQPPKKVESDTVERNGFASLALSPSFVFYNDFKYDDFYFDIGTNYGIVFGKSAVADAGIIEGAVGLSGVFAPKKWRATVGFDIEINFIKNDGVNTIIPGLNLSASVSYMEELIDIVLMSNPPIFGLTYTDEINFTVNGGLYIKCFVLKQLAIVPSVDIGYGSFQKGLIGVGAGLQMRMYF